MEKKISKKACSLKIIPSSELCSHEFDFDVLFRIFTEASGLGNWKCCERQRKYHSASLTNDNSLPLEFEWQYSIMRTQAPMTHVSMRFYRPPPPCVWKKFFYPNVCDIFFITPFQLLKYFTKISLMKNFQSHCSFAYQVKIEKTFLNVYKEIIKVTI